jgi:hypothetical protein
VSPLPTTVSPSSTPTQTPNGTSGAANDYLLYGGITAIILAVAIVGVIVLRKFKRK